MPKNRPVTTEELLTHVQGQRDTWMGICAILVIIIIVLLGHIFGS